MRDLLSKETVTCSDPNCVDGYVPRQPDGQPEPCRVCYPEAFGTPCTCRVTKWGRPICEEQVGNGIDSYCRAEEQEYDYTRDPCNQPENIR